MMTTTITMNKTEYINFVEKIKKEINNEISPKSIPNDKVQEIVARSFGYKSHLDVLSYFENAIIEKESQNFLFKRNFYYFLDLQCKKEDSLSKRVFLLVQTIFFIAEHKNYKLSNRSIERLLPLDVLIKYSKDKKTPDVIKEKILEYLKELPSFTNIRRVNNMLKDQHQNNLPPILIACKMSEKKTLEKLLKDSVIKENEK